jgi:putative transposase
MLYSGNTLKEDKRYFKRREYESGGRNGPSRKARWAKRLSSRRADHFLHTLAKTIVEECVSRAIGTIAVGDLTDIREGANWGRHGNKRIHGWEFARFTDLLDYKARENGTELENVSERDMSKTCSARGTVADKQRVERGLHVYGRCEIVANADVNGAKNIRRTITPSPTQDRSNGWLAQPVVRLFDRTQGVFLPREQAATNRNTPTR